MPKKRKAVAKDVQPVEELEIAKVPCSSVGPNSYNPNRQSPEAFELLIRSIDEDGFTAPILVKREIMKFVDGEHRWTALVVFSFLRKHWPRSPSDALWPEGLIEESRDLRLDIISGSVTLAGDKSWAGTYDGVDPDIPVVLTSMSLAQMKVATLRHNRTRGDEVLTLTSDLMRELRDSGDLEHAQDSLMMDDVELGRLLEDATATDANAEDEMGAAWVPDKAGGDADLADSADKVETGHGTTAMSTEAVEAKRKRDTAIASARTEQDREKIRTESRFYKINLMFTEGSSEAKIIRDALGEQPAETLKAMCEAYVTSDAVREAVDAKRS